MNSSEVKWLVPFAGRNHSGATTQNFLWKKGNVSIMDNHRAALWCWLNDISPSEEIALLHIDEHFDTLYSQIDEWLAHLPNALHQLPIEEYLALRYPLHNDVFPLIRWDNYLSIYLETYSQQVVRSIFVTHKVGDKPRISAAMHPDARQVPGNLAYWFGEFDGRWIVNVDLDFFFYSNEAGIRRPMFSDEYVESLFDAIRRHYENGKIASFTMCLTPDVSYTGGWAQAEELCAKACNILELPFTLPA